MKGCDTNRDGKISKKVRREDVHEDGEADEAFAGADDDPDGAVGAAVISTSVQKAPLRSPQGDLRSP